MAAGPEVGQAHVSLHLTMQQYERELARARAATANATKGMAANFTAVERASTRAAAASHKHSLGIQALSRQFLVLRAAASGAVAVLGVRQIIQAADSWVRLHARLRLVTGSSQAATVEQQKLFKAAQDTRAPLAELAEIYVRVRTATESWGATSDQVLQVTKGLGQVMRISGANAQEGAAALIQFSQGLTKAIVRGDELRSLSENLRGLFEVIGKQTGQTATEVYNAALKSGLAVETVFEALIKGGADLDRQFASLPQTIEESLTQIGNTLTKVVGQAATAGGAMQDTVKAFRELNEVISSPMFVEGMGVLLSFLAEGAKRFAEITSEIGYAAKVLEIFAQRFSDMDLGDILVTATSRDRLKSFFADIQREARAAFAQPGAGAGPGRAPSRQVAKAAADTSNITYPKPPDDEAEKTLDRLNDKLVDLRAKMAAARKESVGDTESAEQLRDLADAADAAGYSIENLVKAPAGIRERVQAYVEESAALRRLEAQTKAIVALDEELTEVRTDMAAAEAEAGGDKEGAQRLQDLAEAAEKAGYSVEKLAQAPAGVRERVEALVEEKAALRAVEAESEALANINEKLADQRADMGVAKEEAAGHKEAALRLRDLADAAEAAGYSLATLDQAPSGVRQKIDEYVAAQAELRKLQEQADRQQQIEAGGQLPTDIDAANIAASGLAATLTDLENLSLESLAQSFQDIAAQIAQAVIQALIFRAIMAGVGGVGPTGGAGAGGAGTPTIGTGAGWTVGAHGLVFGRGGHLKRMARGGFITKRPMIMPMATGGALIGEAGPEAVMPLKRMASGNLGVASEGGGGGAQQVNNIYANNIEPGTVSTLYNLANRAAPGAVVNARSRGLVRERKKPPF